MRVNIYCTILFRIHGVGVYACCCCCCSWIVTNNYNWGAEYTSLPLTLRYTLHRYSKTLDKFDTIRRVDASSGVYGNIGKVVLIFRSANQALAYAVSERERSRWGVLSLYHRLLRHMWSVTPHVDCYISHACNRHKARILWRGVSHFYILAAAW